MFLISKKIKNKIHNSNSQNMESSVKERLISFIKTQDISINKFEKLCGLSTGYVRNMRVSIQPGKIKNIAAVFPMLNTGWLLTGDGLMLKSSNTNIGNEYHPDAVNSPKNYLAQYTDEELDQILQDQYRAHLLQMYEQGKAYPEIVVKKMMAEKDIQIKELQREVWELQKKLKQTADNDTIVAKDGKAE